RGGEPRTDHLPTLVRKTGWRWRGDYYDPAMPLNVELHFRFWDSGMEGFPVEGAEGFWARRVTRAVGPIEIPALAWEDTVRYAAWHITRHLLRGDLRAIHLYEFARLLDTTADDDAFWTRLDLAAAEAIAVRLALACFGCRVHPSVRTLLDRLPARVEKWFDRFAISPLLGAARPNKDELLLHLLLAPAAGDRARILARRLAPSRPPRRVRDPHAPGAAPRKPEWLFLLGRAWFHLRALAPLARNALRC
ncbi:MAG TPA: nucleotidyltransferase family protein, partial [Bryobacteraceae bacterium]|nr:nucleotidyltransferase family protein [Bryobacteraceae bacterium]